MTDDREMLHVDMDAFYASVEQLDNPEYRGKPLVVGGLGNRGVVSACSYEARAFGVHSAMPMYQARKLCPQAAFVRGRMERYSQISRQVIAILHEFSPVVQQISIDEAFLDMTGTQRLFGKSREAALLLKKRVKEETSLNISVGIGSSRFIAKMASDYDKPDGLCRVSPGKEIAFVDAVGLRKLWGIGESTLSSLARQGIRTVAQLRTYEEGRLRHLFGEAAGTYLWKICRGIDPGIHTGSTKSHSISTEMTFPIDVTDGEVLSQNLLGMSHEVMFRAIEEQVVSSTVAINSGSAISPPSVPRLPLPRRFTVRSRSMHWRRSCCTASGELRNRSDCSASGCIRWKVRSEQSNRNSSMILTNASGNSRRRSLHSGRKENSCRRQP